MQEKFTHPLPLHISGKPFRVSLERRFLLLDEHGEVWKYKGEGGQAKFEDAVVIIPGLPRDFGDAASLISSQRVLDLDVKHPVRPTGKPMLFVGETDEVRLENPSGMKVDDFGIIRIGVPDHSEIRGQGFTAQLFEFQL